MMAHNPTVIDNIKRNLVGLKMPRALDVNSRAIVPPLGAVFATRGWGARKRHARVAR